MKIVYRRGKPPLYLSTRGGQIASRLPHKQEKAGSTPAPATNCPHPPTLGEPDQPIICPGPDIGCEACKEAAIEIANDKIIDRAVTRALLVEEVRRARLGPGADNTALLTQVAALLSTAAGKTITEPPYLVPTDHITRMDMQHWQDNAQIARGAAIICPLCQKPVDESNHETVLMNGRPVACHKTCPE